MRAFERKPKRHAPAAPSCTRTRARAHTHTTDHTRGPFPTGKAWGPDVGSLDPLAAGRAQHGVCVLAQGMGSTGVEGWW